MANVRNMRKLVERLEWNPPQGVWVAYGERNSYTDDDAERKDEFVREVATSQRWHADLGHRRQQRPLLADRRRGLGLRGRASTPTRARSSCSTAACATRATRRS